jgi:hypothetical protein
MMLFINTRCSAQGGWHGYDLVVNRRVRDAQTTVVERTKAGWNWLPCTEATYRVAGNELMLALPRGLLQPWGGRSHLQFEFKWADNIQNEDNIEEFTLNGDSAPSGRFNYLYCEQP